MKENVKWIFSIVIQIWSYLYSYEVSIWIQQQLNSLYTMWIRNYFEEIGKGTRFRRPIRLEGGSRKIHIGANTLFNSFCVLGCWRHFGADTFDPEIFIGDNCNFGEFSQITAINKITIGDGLLTGRFVYIGDNAHGGLSWEEAGISPSQRHLKSKGEIRIGNNVWIGDRVTILGGVTIGDDVIIGANSVVTHDVLSNSLVVGSPAKVVKTLHAIED